jgi:predicted phosphohydrolase
MEFQYISDIHTEHFNDQQLQQFMDKINVESDICVLAGDIGNPFLASYTAILEDFSKKFKKIFIIAGNHEYYFHDMDEAYDQMKKIADTLPNVSFLDNSFEDYENVRWIGTTQWTKITNPQYTIRDNLTIKNMTIDLFNEIHEIAREFISETLKKSQEENIPCVVITHHLPSDSLTHPKFKNNFLVNYNQWYSANLDDIIIQYSSVIKAWVYGHTHIKSVQSFYGVNFLCNPIGYVDETTNQQINEKCMQKAFI